MMEKIEKLVVALTALAEEAREYLERVNHPEKMVQMHLPMAAAAAEAPAAAAEEPVLKKPRKAKAPAPAATPEETGVSGIEGAATPEAGHAEAQAKAEKTSYDRMMEVTKQWVILAKNDSPKDGKVVAMEALAGMGKAKLGDLTHEERLGWIALVEGWIASRGGKGE
jgi:hypothetical protein